jgi:hypothetical protein
MPLPPCLPVQVHPNSFLPKEWIMEKWEEGFYITAVAGSDSNNSLVVMSKGARFSQQSYKVCACLSVCLSVCLSLLAVGL